MKVIIDENQCQNHLTIQSIFSFYITSPLNRKIKPHAINKYSIFVFYLVSSSLLFFSVLFCPVSFNLLLAYFHPLMLVNIY
jgi:hypothetical protein